MKKTKQLGVMLIVMSLFYPLLATAYFFDNDEDDMEEIYVYRSTYDNDPTHGGFNTEGEHHAFRQAVIRNFWNDIYDMLESKQGMEESQNCLAAVAIRREVCHTQADRLVPYCLTATIAGGAAYITRYLRDIISSPVNGPVTVGGIGGACATANGAAHQACDAVTVNNPGVTRYIPECGGGPASF